MAIRNILKSDDELLRKKSREVTEFDERLSRLIDDMIDTLRHANGVGLAAPQVGVLKRVVVINIGEEYKEIVNPSLTGARGLQMKEEGCLSCPGIQAVKRRPAVVSIKGLDRYGNPVKYTGDDLTARAFCHETDHLNGVLIIDKPVQMSQIVKN